MQTIASLKKRVDRLAKNIRGTPEVEYVTCWGDEVPEDWKEGEYFITEWAGGTLEDDEMEEQT